MPLSKHVITLYISRVLKTMILDVYFAINQNGIMSLLRHSILRQSLLRHSILRHAPFKLNWAVPYCIWIAKSARIAKTIGHCRSIKSQENANSWHEIFLIRWNIFKESWINEWNGWSIICQFGLLKAPELQRLSVTVEVLRVGVMIVGVISE
jgi:hypothetical protein